MKNGFIKSKICLYTMCIVLIAGFAGCKKDSGIAPAQNTADFPEKTEWVGTLNGNGFQYRPPVCLKFNSDNTFTMYAIFVFFPNNVETRKDSITGTIQKMDTLPDGRMRITTDITTSFNGGPTKYLYVTDKQKIQGVSADQTVETFQLSLFPKAVSVAGDWSGPAWKGGFAYPDLSSIKFDNSNPAIPVTNYIQNGTAVRNAADPTSGVLGVLYGQRGARVYFSGYDETKRAPGYGGTIIPYFGVLLPGGDKMMVDSRVYDVRLPNYINTNESYGSNGITPVIIRK